MVKWAPAIESVQLADAAVQTRVLADAAVDTAKIATLAVTNAEIANATITKLKIGDQEVDIQRMLDPIAWDRTTGFAQDVTLDTTKRHQVDVLTDVPSWAGEVLLFGMGHIQLTNSTGGNYELVVNTVMDDTATPIGGTTTTIIDGTVDVGFDFDSEVVVAPGSTIETRLWGWLSSGTNSINIWQLDIAELFKR